MDVAVGVCLFSDASGPHCYRPDFTISTSYNVGGGGVVVKALRYKPAGRGFDSRWCHWNSSLT